MSFLKYSISYMRCDFKSDSCFFDVMEYAGFAVVRELGSDGAIVALVSNGNDLAFAFGHLVISGVS